MTNNILILMEILNTRPKRIYRVENTICIDFIRLDFGASSIIRDIFRDFYIVKFKRNGTLYIHYLVIKISK